MTVPGRSGPREPLSRSLRLRGYGAAACADRPGSRFMDAVATSCRGGAMRSRPSEPAGTVSLSSGGWSSRQADLQRATSCHVLSPRRNPRRPGQELPSVLFMMSFLDLARALSRAAIRTGAVAVTKKRFVTSGFPSEPSKPPRASPGTSQVGSSVSGNRMRSPRTRAAGGAALVLPEPSEMRPAVQDELSRSEHSQAEIDTFVGRHQGPDGSLDESKVRRSPGSGDRRD